MTGATTTLSKRVIELLDLRQKLIRAIAEEDDRGVAVLALTVAERAQEDFQTFHTVLNALGYHNRLSVLNDVMRTAWSVVQEDRAAFSKPAVTAYAARATDHLIYEYVAGHPEPDANDPHLLQKLESYFTVDPDRLTTYLRLLTGTVGRPWSMHDFTPLQMGTLNGLLVEFLGYANRFEQIPFSRAHLVREQLPRYLMDRQAGNLYAKQDMATLLQQGRSSLPTTTSEPEYPLCPDRITLELFLRRLLQTIEPLPYAAAATLGLVPAWLRFLQARELITARQRTQTLHELSGLGTALNVYWQNFDDPILQQDAVTWPNGNG